ncbi:MAG TPA: phosphoribosyltransferase family protein [Candidatus Saccharimonadales bacterium]|nr:phosphoribosyltransferase family protein [Candidatus Saccharimonadales bacterium]
MIEQIISLIAPHSCISCHTEGPLLCPTCQLLLPVTESTPWVYGGQISAATPYTGFAKEMVHRLKFERAKDAARTMAAIMAKRMSIAPDAVVTHVPTATSRARVRGYDQASLLARQLAYTTGLRYIPLLERIGQQRQVGHTKQERQMLAEGIFRVINADAAKDRPILLVDDVLTTGSTLRSAAETLAQSGVSGISAAVFAKA